MINVSKHQALFIIQMKYNHWYIYIYLPRNSLRCVYLIVNVFVKIHVLL